MVTLDEVMIPNQPVVVPSVSSSVSRYDRSWLKSLVCVLVVTYEPPRG
jgi:hypothetical protein